jgi:hypothetical protein
VAHTITGMSLRGDHNIVRPEPEQRRATVDTVPLGWDYTPLWARLLSYLLAARYDRKLAAGVLAEPASPMAIHAWRITSTTERRALSRTLRRCVRDAGLHSSFVVTARIPLAGGDIRGAAPLIDAITQRLDAQQPVSACGMARLRVLLAEGYGPLYRDGRGDLHGRLAVALAVL